MPGTARHRRIFLPVLGAMVVLAWMTLWLWARSPYGRYLAHGDALSSGPAAGLCRAIPGGSPVLQAAFYALSWTLMIMAMMLPTTLSLSGAVERIVADRPHRLRVLALLYLGYVAIWSAFGLLAHGLHMLLLSGVARVPAMIGNGWLIGAATLACAGAFQFSKLKHRCLEQCRTPLSFVIGHWRGRAPEREAFALGLHHGLFCVGCCWALMLLMFVVGAGSLGWMLVLACVMAIEKNLAWGRRIGAPLGAALLVWSAVLVAVHG